MAKRSSLLELVKCRWREFRREPSAFFFVLLMPLIWMVLLGFGLSGESPETFGVGWEAPVVASSEADAIHEGLKGAKNIHLHEGSSADLATMLKRGDVLVLAQMTSSGMNYSYDPANRESRRARDVVDTAVQRAAGRHDPMISQDVRVSIAGTRYVDFLVPGLLAMTIMSTSLWGTGMTMVANRRENLLKRFLATPMQPYEYILSHIIGRGMILVFELSTILISGAVIFHFRLAGRFFDFIVMAALGAAALTSIGIFAGSRTTNSAAMNGVCNLVALPLMIFSGVWFSRSNLPSWLAEASRWLPLTPLVDGLRRIALEGVPLSSLGFEVALLLGYFVIGTVGARVAFKWY